MATFIEDFTPLLPADDDIEIGIIPKGTILRVKKKNDNNIICQFPNGLTLIVPISKVIIAPPLQKPEEVLVVIIKTKNTLNQS